MLWKCSVCGYIYEGDAAPEKCPKCAVPEHKFSNLSEEAANKITDSTRTNDIHMELIKLAARMKRLAEEGMEINLDSTCYVTFKKAQEEAGIIKQRSKSEIADHAGRGKW